MTSLSLDKSRTGSFGAQGVSLLKTKLYIPPLRSELVSRPRLIERLDAALGQNGGVARKLTLISAPAGFGKTTFLSECAARCGWPVAWVSLDEGDNDPTRFWAYFVAALRTIPSLAEADVGGSVLAALRSFGAAGATVSPPIEALLTSLINEIVEIPGTSDSLRSGPLALVLDDFHLITEQQIHEGLIFLLDNLPPQMHVILSGRADPPWPLARLRARREMTELRVRDLRFTSDEATAFLNDAMRLDLSPEDMAALEARTEGWIAGLQMAALALQPLVARQETPSMRGRQDVSGFIKAFAGTHRFVLDYLVEEVLDRQSPAVREFLLKTSILEQMTAPVCDALTDGTDSQTILIQLEQGNLFLVPLDDERRWYRYHRLFADLLRSRLEQTQPDQAPTLHRRASEWYEKNGLIAEAVSHALQAGDVEGVVNLVEGNALAMMEHGELKALEGWLNDLPTEIIRSQPWLCIARAWILVFTGQLDAVEPLLQDAEKAIAASETPSEERRIMGHIVSIRSGVALIRGDVMQATSLAREALERLPVEDAMMRGWVTANLGVALSWSGDLLGSEQAFGEAAAISQARKDGYVSVMALCNVAVAQMDRGQLGKAAGTFRETIRLADEYAGRSGQPLPVVGYAHTYLADILREWNDLESAISQVREGIDLCKRWGEPQLLASGYVRLARVLQAMGDVDGAFGAMREAKRAASSLSSWYVDRVAADEVRLLLAQGDVAVASRWAASWKNKVSVDDPFGFRYEMVYRALSKVFIAQGDLDRALRLLARLLQVFESAGAEGYVIEALVLQAIAFRSKEEGEQALSSLERALTLAEPEGYVRIFIDEGAPMGELLKDAAARGRALDYVDRLLGALEKEREDDDEPTMEALPPLTMVEPLSRRERQVLRLMATNLSMPDIAEELVIAVSTVRSHVKSIYGKLGVHSRYAAVARAQELNLL